VPGIQKRADEDETVENDYRRRLPAGARSRITTSYSGCYSTWQYRDRELLSLMSTLARVRLAVPPHSRTCCEFFMFSCRFAWAQADLKCFCGFRSCAGQRQYGGHPHTRGLQHPNRFTRSRPGGDDVVDE
jgi:hypothetical protein